MLAGGTVGRLVSADPPPYPPPVWSGHRNLWSTSLPLYLYKEWQQLWNQRTSNKLYSVQPASRYDSVLINRLRIGHTRLTNLLKGESQPVCEACHSPLTVKHFLVDCTRQRYFGVDTLKDVFENVASRNIIAYVKDIGFYNRI